MKLLKHLLQLLLIMLFLLVGNWISELIKSVILIPGSIIGMLLLFAFLCTGIIKLNHIEDVSGFFLKNMGFFFIPLGVSLVESYSSIQTVWWQVAIILIISNIVVMGVTAKVVEVLIQRKAAS